MGFAETTTFLSSGSGTRCVALADERFVPRLLQLPRLLPEAEWRVLAEATEDPGDAVARGRLLPDGSRELGPDAADCVVQACLALAGEESWRTDDALSTALAPRAPDLLGTERAGPWWLAERFHGNCAYGLIGPARVAELARALASTPELHGLAGFLGSIAGRDRWVVATEWT